MIKKKCTQSVTGRHFWILPEYAPNGDTFPYCKWCELVDDRNVKDEWLNRHNENEAKRA